jgi:hypothetical protein
MRKHNNDLVPSLNCQPVEKIKSKKQGRQKYIFISDKADIGEGGLYLQPGQLLNTAPGHKGDTLRSHYLCWTTATALELVPLTEANSQRGQLLSVGSRLLRGRGKELNNLSFFFQVHLARKGKGRYSKR